MGGVLETAVASSSPPVILSALRTVGVMAAVARRSAPVDSPCCVGDHFPQSLLLTLLPLVEDTSAAVCAATLRTLQSLVRASDSPAATAPSISTPIPTTATTSLANGDGGGASDGAIVGGGSDGGGEADTLTAVVVCCV